jgi:RNA ligase.
MAKPILLSREAFKHAVFERDGYKCVFCDELPEDAHHILERRLWPDGGYYLDNGVAVCSEHHIACETTELSVEDVRAAAGIRRILVPPHLYPDQPYDKWGNPILPNGQRMRGELFGEESVQKILAKGGMLERFTHLVKYPRTHHLPWSQCINDDDRVMPSLEALEGIRVIASEKRDGENTTMYRDHIHARSIDGRHHPSRDWVKQFWSTIMGDIPEGWRICGENLFARHSIRYEDLGTYFEGFSIWTDRNECLGWDDTLEWFELLGIRPVPVLYDGIFDVRKIQELWSEKDWDRVEGYVVRDASMFAATQFRFRVGKFVRHDHLQTVRHGNRIIEKNGLLLS